MQEIKKKKGHAIAEKFERESGFQRESRFTTKQQTNNNSLKIFKGLGVKGAAIGY
jgi:hypothetical protein